MNNSRAQFGMVGLGTMGRNFLLNVAEHGFSCAGFDIDAAKRQLLLAESGGLNVVAAGSLPEFVAALERPRRVMLLVPAGKIVDAVINDLLPHLEAGDVVIDGGNSHFLETERREILLLDKGIEFIGVGVSGGEEGARHGASIMPGGRREVYEHVRPIFEAVAAKVGGEPCVAYMGNSSAGHFVKMVHNGIEYGLMQILAETYDFMLRVLKMNYSRMSETFARWNDSELNSFLVEITSEVLRKIDAETGKPLVEMILDKAAQKGTGKWTSQAAMDFGVPIPTIDAAVAMRQISAQKEARILIAEKFGSRLPKPEAHPLKEGQIVSSRLVTSPKAARAEHEVETTVSLHHKEKIDEITAKSGGETAGNEADERKNARLREEFAADFGEFVEQLKNALLSSFIVTYAQGLSLLQTVSKEKNYNLNLSEITKIWRGGCIIRSALLEEMRRAFSENPELPNLILDERFAEILNRNREDWRAITAKFTESRIPALCLSSALAYFDAFRSARLPANLIQAQRDFFGAHTYQRIDKEGIFHTPDWNE
ncbi:MAG TPA: NADP-dependent phosphogluconate dehydrogenase [Pyrinomonadaceae bacterium]|nr:NADP-dependent phosphogluconate dehydrogenase [Pyrinomonadaceae bacterium]